MFQAKGFIGIPLYLNVGLLAARAEDGRVSAVVDEVSWDDLASMCEEWEHRKSDESQLFFDLTHADENYNCLFLEIMLSRRGLTTTGGRPQLGKWLLSDSTATAAKVLWRLCRRAYHWRRAADGTSRQDGRRLASPEARVSRLWFSELGEVFPKLNATRLSVLPGELSVAGEWYLTVPAYSAAPDVALEMMKVLTTVDSELNRLKAGIGLPTRSTFYKSADNVGMSASVSQYCPVNPDILGRVVTSCFARSSLPQYRHSAPLLSECLKKLLELRNISSSQLDESVRSEFANLAGQISSGSELRRG